MKKEFLGKRFGTNGIENKFFRNYPEQISESHMAVWLFIQYSNISFSANIIKISGVVSHQIVNINIDILEYFPDYSICQAMRKGIAPVSLENFF
jgi:hypothetical protein